MITAGEPTRAGRLGKRCRALAVLVALALLAPGADADAAHPSDGAAARTLERTPAEVRDYWTPERMRRARPVEQRLEAPGRRSATGAAAPSRRSAQQADSTSFPGRTHGKVFFSLPDGDFLCSGTVVSSGGRNLVLTAGHCVYDDEVTQRFATNWMFVPGYRNGHKPFGEWVAERLATTPQFQSRGDLRYDVGAAVVRRDPNGRGVQDVVGARATAFSQPRAQRYRAFGYPAQGRFDGQRLYRCDSPYRGGDEEFSPPRPMRIDCEMTGGASGGGWVVEGRTVVSVTSYGYDYPPLLCELDPASCPERDKLFGPYFGSAIRDLYRATRGREVRCGGRVVDHRGTGGPDGLVGTMRPDVIHGLGGADVLRGHAGDDVICGGRGHDRIFGGPGSNRVYPGRGNDRVFVRAPGRNRVFARQGRNRIRCGPGRDRVITNQRSRVHRSCNVVIRR